MFRQTQKLHLQEIYTNLQYPTFSQPKHVSHELNSNSQLCTHDKIDNLYNSCINCGFILETNNIVDQRKVSFKR